MSRCAGGESWLERAPRRGGCFPKPSCGAVGMAHLQVARAVEPLALGILTGRDDVHAVAVQVDRMVPRVVVDKPYLRM